jgi:hypothetical protein
MRASGVFLVILMWLAVALSQEQAAPTEAITSALRARDFERAVQLSRAALQRSAGDARLWTLQGIARIWVQCQKRSSWSGTRAVKVLSPHHRFVIALHSPGGVAETGLRVCPAEKNARKLARDVRTATFSGAV